MSPAAGDIYIRSNGRQPGVCKAPVALGQTVVLHVSGFCRFLSEEDVRRALTTLCSAYGVLAVDVASFSDGPPPYAERRKRDQGKETQGWCLLTFATEAAAATAAAGLEGTRLEGSRLSVAPSRSRVVLSAERAALAAAAAAELAATREHQREHNQRQRQRKRERSSSALLALLSSLPAPGGAGAASAFAALDGLQASLDWALVAEAALPRAALLDRKALGLPSPAPHVTREQSSARCLRKEVQVESFHLVLRRLLTPALLATRAECPLRIADMGCGSGALLLPLAALFPTVRFSGVDMDAEALRILEARAAAAGLANVDTRCSMVERCTDSFDVILALHACGNATDWALLQAVSCHAAYLVSPCCTGKLAFSLTGGSSFSANADAAGRAPHLPPLTHPRSAWLRAQLKDAALFADMAAAADVSHGEAEDEALLGSGGVQSGALGVGRLAKANLEIDRNEAAREAGYCTALFTLVKPQLQAKNHLLVGVPPAETHPLAATWTAALRQLQSDTTTV